MRLWLMGQAAKRNGGQARSSVSAPNATAAPGATRRDHAFVPTKDVTPSRPERTGMSQPYVRTVPGTLPLSPAAAYLAHARHAAARAPVHGTRHPSEGQPGPKGRGRCQAKRPGI